MKKNKKQKLNRITSQKVYENILEGTVDGWKVEVKCRG